MAEIKTKKEFFKLWRAGMLGNTLQTWTARDVAEGRMPNGPVVGIRYADPRGGGGRCDYEVPRVNVPMRLLQWQRDGLDVNYATVCESAPDEKNTLQGEICRTTAGLVGFLEVGSQKRMRDAINAGLLKHYSYCATRVLMRRYMDENTLDDVEALLERYPDATIEFTSYTVNLGCLPNRNTIIWEVRNY